MIMRDIQSAFQFNLEDLEANRLGKATPQQIKRLNYTKGCTFLFLMPAVVGGCFLVGGLGVFALLGLMLFPSGDTANSLFPSGISGATMIIFVLLPLLFIIIPVIFLRQLQQDQREKRLASCTGDFSITSGFRHDSAYDCLHIAAHTFKITSAQTRALRPYRGQRLIVYYFPHSRQIASVEVSP